MTSTIIYLALAGLVGVAAFVKFVAERPAQRIRGARFTSLAGFVVLADGTAASVAVMLGHHLGVEPRRDDEVWLLARPGVAATVEVSDAGAGSMVAFLPHAELLFRKDPSADDRAVEDLLGDLRIGLAATTSRLIAVAGNHGVVGA